jgi:hypothetical protein
MVCLEWTVKVVYRWKIRPSIPQNRVHLMIDGKVWPRRLITNSPSGDFNIPRRFLVRRSVSMDVLDRPQIC